MFIGVQMVRQREGVWGVQHRPAVYVLHPSGFGHFHSIWDLGGSNQSAGLCHLRCHHFGYIRCGWVGCLVCVSASSLQQWASKPANESEAWDFFPQVSGQHFPTVSSSSSSLSTISHMVHTLVCESEVFIGFGKGKKSKNYGAQNSKQRAWAKKNFFNWIYFTRKCSVMFVIRDLDD